MFIHELFHNYCPNAAIKSPSEKNKKSTQLLVVDTRTLSIAVKHKPLYTPVKILSPKIVVERLTGRGDI